MNTTRMRRSLAVALTFATLVPAAAMAKNQATRGTAKLRLVHDFATDTVPQPADVDVRIGRDASPAANPVAATLAYGDVGPKFLRPRAGVTTIAVFAKGDTTTPLFTTTLTLGGRDRLTAIARQVAIGDTNLTLEVLSEKDRQPKRRMATVRVFHGLPSADADGVRVGPIGGPCLTGQLSFGDDVVLDVAKGSHELGVFPATDTACGGDPLPGLRATLNLRSRSNYTVIARIKKGDAQAFELVPVRDF